jgi:molybdenum cofactor biosynthesis protein B
MDGLPVSVNAAIVGVGSDEAAPKVVVETLGELGHRFVHVKQVVSGAPLLPTLTAWVEDPTLDIVIVVTPDVGSVRDTLDPLVTRDLPGFAELFRIAAFGEIGSSAMLLDADAARCGNTFVFVLPNLVGAVKVALERLLIPQLDTRTRPISLASKFPRLREAAPRRAKTESGSGVHPIAPARTVPPPVPRTMTAPIGEIVRTPAVAAAEEPVMIASDAAILIPPAVIVDDPEPAKAAATPDQTAAFVASLEAHAREVRRTQSQVAVLPQRPKTEPPPVPKKTDAELKAERDAQVTEAISKVEPLPRAKNMTTPQQWASASSAIAKITSKPAEPTLAALQSRDRVIAVPAQRSGRRLLWVPVALLIGGGTGLLVKTQFSGNRSADAADQPSPQPPPAQVAETPPPVDQPAPLPPEEPIEITVQVPVGSAETPDLTSVAQQAPHHHHAAATPPPAETGSDTDVADPRTHPDIAPASPDCDEASCILERYERECCARYKPAAEAPPPAPPALPATLDKTAVKDGIAGVKPLVQQCGEQHRALGEVEITLTVDASGQVTGAVVAASPDPELGTCVAKALERATFAKTQTGAVFTYPFMF